MKVNANYIAISPMGFMERTVDRQYYEAKR